MGKDRNQRAFGGKQPPYAGLRKELLRSPAYRSLSCTARALLLEFALLYKGYDNGKLYLSVRDAADRLGLSDTNAASAAFGELMDMGFIALEVEHTFTSHADKVSKARCWRLVWERTDTQDATNDYRQAIARGRGQARQRRGMLALQRYERKSAGRNFKTAIEITDEVSKTVNCNDPTKAGGSVLESNTAIAQEWPITVDGQRPGIPDTYSYTISSAAPAGSSLAPMPLKTAGGDFARQRRSVDPLHLGYLRQRVKAHIEASGYGASKALAEEAGVSEPVLSRFKNGKNLPERHFVALQLAMRKIEARKAA